MTYPLRCPTSRTHTETYRNIDVPGPTSANTQPCPGLPALPGSRAVVALLSGAAHQRVVIFSFLRPNHSSVIRHPKSLAQGGLDDCNDRFGLLHDIFIRIRRSKTPTTRLIELQLAGAQGVLSERCHDHEGSAICQVYLAGVVGFNSRRLGSRKFYRPTGLFFRICLYHARHSCCLDSFWLEDCKCQD